MRARRGLRLDDVGEDEVHIRRIRVNDEGFCELDSDE